jgi:hypothetical protein
MRSEIFGVTISAINETLPHKKQSKGKFPSLYFYLF